MFKVTFLAPYPKFPGERGAHPASFASRQEAEKTAETYRSWGTWEVKVEPIA